MAATVVTLKDGSKILEKALVGISMNLDALHKENYIAFFDLVEKCRNASYQINSTPLGDSRKILIQKGLLSDDDQVHDDIRKVVLNSIKGSGMKIQLISPLSPRELSVVKDKQ